MCDMEASEKEQDMIDIAASIQRNTQIQKLSLKYLDEDFLSPILSSLASNSSVKELALLLDERWPEATEDAVKSLLESTSTIVSYKLSGEINGEENFLPIAQGLINSDSVTDITFDNFSLYS
jgi:hypothetical protein